LRPAVALREELDALGVAVYVRARQGQRGVSVAALTVNAASEALDFRTRSVAAADALPELLETEVLARVDSARTVVLGADGDPALAALGSGGMRLAALRQASAADGGADIQIRWLRGRPRADEPAGSLVSRLASRDLLWEPLDRLERLIGLSAERLSAAAVSPPLAVYLRQAGPVDWPYPFLPYQLDGIRALLRRPRLLLADDMGLGKTVQAIAALRVLIRTGALEHALVVVPAGLVGQWYRALREWAPELRVSVVQGGDRAWRWRAEAHVYVVSFETLRADDGDHPSAGPRLRRWGAVVLDEAQKIKNRDIDVARTCRRLPRERSWALTGTPLENSVDDLRSICEFLLGPDASPRQLADPSRLRQVHARLQLRRRKRDVLTELPPKRVIEVPLQLGARQRASYDTAERDGVVWLRQLGRAVTITHVLELITRLKQICNFCPVSGDSAKFDDLNERLRVVHSEGNRALVFTQYTDAQFGVAALARRLADLRPVVYTGALNAEDRNAAIVRFEGADPPSPLILSLRAGGVGLNLQAASYVFHYDRWWNPAVELQAEDRSHRMGQSQPVTVYAYICENTIEERVQQILSAKGELFRDWIDGVGLQVGMNLTEQEIFGLVGLPASDGAAQP
jgi:superfamily II DNA or RNA helicase